MTKQTFLNHKLNKNTIDHYAVIGNPIQHSLSPIIHQHFAKQTKQSLTYHAIFAEINQFEPILDQIKQQGFKGVNITLPFKLRAFTYCNYTSTRAKQAEAVNTLLFHPDGTCEGDNTDGIGLIRDLECHLDFCITGKRILLLGAGGAARGVIGPLLTQQPACLTLANRTRQKAIELANAFDHALVAIGLDELNGQFDCIINATSAGLSKQKFNLDTDLLTANTLCYDMVYGKETAFLTWAKKAGVSYSDGLGMLIEQAAEAFFLWRGIRPETADLLKNIRNFI